MRSTRYINDAAIVFRHAVSGDADRLLQFAARTYYHTFASSNTPENMQAYMTCSFTLPQFKAELNDPHAIFILAETEEQLTAYAKLLPDEAPECVTGDAPIELVRFYVDEPWHGSGLASALMEVCLTEAKEGGFKTMYLGVWEKNFRAQAFYRKWDFMRVGEHIFKMGDDSQIDWWMMRAV
jgi:ribosomal protein S18 acetylase RimI-like enzyme